MTEFYEAVEQQREILDLEKKVKQIVSIDMPKMWNKAVYVSATKGRGKKTSQGGGNVSTSTMNKNKKANYKKYRGQGK